MKLLELNDSPNQQRQKFLSEKFSIEFVAKEDGFSKKWLDQQKDLDCVLVSDAYSKTVIQEFSNLPADVGLIKACDMIERTEGRWWPRVLLSQALHDIIIERCPKLDTRAVGYVTGAGAAAKTAVEVLFQLGFKKINMTAPDLEVLSECIEEIRVKHFGVDFFMVQNTELTLQPNNGSILINTIPFSSKEPLLEDLYYLNFVKSTGLVVDLSILPLKNPLIEEAENVGTKSVTGAEIQGVYDWLLLSRLHKNSGGKFAFAMSKEDYLKEWQKFLQESEIQPKV